MADKQQNHDNDKQHELQAQQKSLLEWEVSLKKQANDIAEQKQVVQQNQREIKQQQQELDFQKQSLTQREGELTKGLESLNARSLKLDKRHQQQEVRQNEIEQGLPALRDRMFAEREEQLEQLQSQLKQQLAGVAEKEQQLKFEREQLTLAQEEVNTDFAEQRAGLQKELQQLRLEKNNELNSDLQQQSEQAFNKLEEQLKQRRDDLETHEQQLEKQLAKLRADENIVNLKQAEQEQLQHSLEQEIEERTNNRMEEFERAQQQFEKDKQRLLDRIERQDQLHSLYDELEKSLGDRSAEEVLKDLTAKNEELIELRKQLERPSKELEEVYDTHRAEVTRLEHKNETLQKDLRETQDKLDSQEQLDSDIERLQRQHDSLNVNYDAVRADNNKLREELKRLSPAYNEPQTIAERIQNIKRPYVEKFVPRREGELNELEWLKEISSEIDNYGLHFSSRILCAFHTALKISEWSPLTVLAGVSGTGKSELPKLYSRFGGINFINVPVQPNWDSQESMLGYFNSISNSYEAQPMLNFLVQSREKLINDHDNKENNYNGLEDTVSLVLLDEMNLAHVELYFADFLSKLEQRRAAKNTELPFIEINLGSDLDPYKLSLGRNLLFAGTMNQDETTKSLSDKVIDRGTSIFFPRPESLHRREELKPLSKQAPLLTMKTWWGWINKSSYLNEADVTHYKQLVEDINKCLGKDGRALGHRVWQSIEYYMVNHPLVRGLDAEQQPDEFKQALKFAFEDQLVQKVMPKMRGIETRGYANEHCLSPIRELLANHKLNILDDFDKAMRIGHGQFSWSSADYLNNEQSNQRYQELFDLVISLATKNASGVQAQPSNSKGKSATSKKSKENA